MPVFSYSRRGCSDFEIAHARHQENLMRKFVIPAELERRLMARRGRLHAYDSYNSHKTALVVVDMQNFFMKEGELMCAPGATDIVANVNRLAQTVRDTGGLVVWVVMEATDESRDAWDNFHELFHPQAQARRFGSLGRHGVGYKLWPDMIVGPKDKTLVKQRYSAFIQGSSDIEATLRTAEIETVLVTGVATNVCCESTARDCMMRGFRTIMVSDGNASFTEAEHEAALLNFITYFGDVQSTDEVVTRLTVKTPMEA
jgi:ureidoacrylate peracid hydrolase